jgi:spermidine/putrescine-binding protein
MHVLIHMIDAQKEYFADELIADFENRYDVDVAVHEYENIDELTEAMSGHDTIDLVKVPFGTEKELIRDDQIVALDAFLSEDEIARYEKDYLLVSFAAHNGRYYFVPRKLETRLTVYLKSKVKDALQRWRYHQKSLDSALALINGGGLPATYRLEEDPGTWDYFDILMLGWVWARTPYNDTLMPRIAHRGKHYSGTAQRLIDRVFQCNGDTAAVMTMETDAVVDAFYWEAVYRALGIFHPAMWRQRWSGSGVWQGFARGDVFLSFMTQVDCFFLHGTVDEEIPGYLQEPDDMGVAVMPRGCALSLDAQKNVTYTGTHGTTTGGWWWAIPRKASDTRNAYTLARFITSRKNQIAGCSRFGMIPVRKDILSDLALMFGGGWITTVYNTSLRQLQHNGHTTLPAHRRFGEIVELYLTAWDDIVVTRNWNYDKDDVPDRDYIARVLEKEYAPRARKIAGMAP